MFNSPKRRVSEQEPPRVLYERAYVCTWCEDDMLVRRLTFCAVSDLFVP